jgi:hypothetical protein
MGFFDGRGVGVTGDGEDFVVADCLMHGAFVYLLPTRVWWWLVVRGWVVGAVVGVCMLGGLGLVHC